LIFRKRKFRSGWFWGPGWHCGEHLLLFASYVKHPPIYGWSNSCTWPPGVI